ncbi:MAG: LuxR C-terminal-related transcriptional regulator [Chloroflexi bacterium]|nr:LuxR C-terminal-related transcriptional regulator [Chloroflexota bacterium]
MEKTLLATKVRVPPQPNRTVQRERLIDVLANRVPHHKLILLSAPAGYGKTTLLSQWANTSQLSVAWLSISEEDNDLERFLRYMLAAWEVVQPDIIESRLGVLLGAMSPDIEAALVAFVNLAQTFEEHTVFVLDDYHLIEDPAIHEALAFLIDHLPPTAHFVLATRGEPPLPVARYRARNELLELRTDDLQFLPDETTDFLNHLMALELDQDKITALQHEVEGWVAGLQLVALTLQQRLAGGDKLLVSGRQRFIADYLSEDVLAPLELDTCLFLLQTSIVDHLCALLCDALTGQHNGQEMLEALERQNLFLLPLDDTREWFRYHHLFADFLQQELHRRLPDQITELHRRAAGWYLDHDLPEQAFHHALAGDDVELVVRIFDCYVTAKLNSGELRVIERWINALPAEWYAAYPVLSLARVGFLAYTGAFEACMHCLNDVEQQLMPVESESDQWQMARVITIRCMLACMQNDLTQAEDYADHALRDLPEDDLNWRPGIYVALGDVYRQNGQWDKAKESYRKALSVTHAPQIRFMAAHVFGALADLDLRQGRLKSAANYWQQALAVIQEHRGRLPLPITGWVYIRLGELLYEWNQLAEARKHLAQGLEYAEVGGDVRALIAGYLILGRLALTEGDIQVADEYMEKARPLVEKAQFTHWTSRFERFQLDLWLAQDQLRTAVNWSDQMLDDAAFDARLENETTQLAVTRVLMVRGDASAIDRAFNLLEHLLTTAEQEGRMGVTIEALVLQALAHWKRGEQAYALSALERGLRLAEPENYQRTFADLGLAMGRLLQEAYSRDVMPDYIEKLLDAFDISAVEQPPLPEPLTSREIDVLELMAAGLTNREIAEMLVISPETVKKHTGNIYGKLGVNNRTEAAVRARELDLLG